MKNIRTVILVGLLVALFIIGVLLTGCNRKLCPAYTKAVTEQATAKI